MMKEGVWKQSNLQVFWGEIAPSDHLVQIYEDDRVFLDSLVGFAGSGFLAGDAVIIIATSEHLKALDTRLRTHDFDLDKLIETDQYIPVDAKEALSKFMVKNWPDVNRFNELVKSLISRARKSSGRIRAFGEMVAILWAKGNVGATVHLEHLWNKFCETEAFCLFCAYPQSGFTEDANVSLQHICSAHTKVVAGWHKPSTEVYYRKAS